MYIFVYYVDSLLEPLHEQVVVPLPICIIVIYFKKVLHINI